MPDPISNPQAQAIAQSAKASGLANLLKGGPVKGQVISTTADKAEVLLNGKQFTLPTKGAPLKAGQQILARLVGGQVSLAPFSASAASQSALAQSQTIFSQLQQLGIQGGNAQVIAQALLQAGVPINKQIILELAKILPQIGSDQAASLAFLLSRGLPVNSAMAAWFTYILKPRPSIEKSFGRLRTALNDFINDKGLQDSIPNEMFDAIKEIGEQLDRRFSNMRGQSTEEFEKEVADWFKRALSTLESRMQGGQGDPDDVILRLIRLLQQLKPYISDAGLLERWQTVLEATKDAHESLTTQAVKNLPQQSAESPVFFGQVPIKVDGEEQTLEFRYRRNANHDGGALEVRVELSALGQVYTHMIWREPSLRVAVNVESEPIKHHVEQALEELADALAQQGFQLDSLKVNLGDIPDTLEPETKTEDFQTVSGLDMRA